MAYKSTHKSAPQAGASSPSDAWQPSVKYLLVLLLAEIVLVGVIRSFMPHGG